MPAPPQGLMNLVVRDRAQGKTTALIEWLLAPESGPFLLTRGQRGFPYWKRIIITAEGERERTRLQRLIGHKFMEVCDQRGWFLEDFDYAIKAVWRLEELQVMRKGNRQPINAEFAFDNLDWLIDRHISDHLGKQPSLLTMTGEVKQ